MFVTLQTVETMAAIIAVILTGQRCSFSFCIYFKSLLPYTHSYLRKTVKKLNCQSQYYLSSLS